MKEKVKKSWSRTKLTKMLYHSFIGSIADNVIEIAWVLCFSLLANKAFVEKTTIMFGVNDAFWVILSSTYYTARTSLTAILPKLLIQKGKEVESKVVKNHIYLFYMMLLPLGIVSFIFLPNLLLLLGVPKDELTTYVPYFGLSIISILIAAPWSVFIPSYYRTIGKSKEGMMLDHLIAWSMIFGIFFTTHVLHMGPNEAMIVNMITNAIPLYWFLWKKPIPNFFSKGLEFSFEEIKRSWKIVKWEIIRRLSPRVAAIIGVSLMIKIDPIYAGITYWLSNTFMFVEGWIDSAAGLLNSHVSRNVGLKEKNPEKDNEFVFRKAVAGLVVTIVLVYIISKYCLTFLPESIYKGILNPYVYILAFIDFTAKLRYYMWLSVSRAHRNDLNGMAQLFYAIPTAFLTPFLLWVFLYKFNWGLEGIYLRAAIVAIIQWGLTEVYFRIKMKKS